MNKNKKIFFICFLIFSLSFALASCESDDENQSSSSDSKETNFVSSGAIHNCAVFNNGKLKCWGNNSYGQLRSWQHTRQRIRHR